MCARHLCASIDVHELAHLGNMGHDDDLLTVVILRRHTSNQLSRCVLCVLMLLSLDPAPAFPPPVARWCGGWQGLTSVANRIPGSLSPPFSNLSLSHLYSSCDCEGAGILVGAVGWEVQDLEKQCSPQGSHGTGGGECPAQHLPVHTRPGSGTRQRLPRHPIEG